MLEERAWEWRVFFHGSVPMALPPHLKGYAPSPTPALTLRSWGKFLFFLMHSETLRTGDLNSSSRVPSGFVLRGLMGLVQIGLLQPQRHSKGSWGGYACQTTQGPVLQSRGRIRVPRSGFKPQFSECRSVSLSSYILLKLNSVYSKNFHNSA